jgi:sulfonate transport system permease protein
MSTLTSLSWEATATAPGIVRLPTWSDQKGSTARRRMPRGLERYLGIVVFIGAWQLASSIGLLTPDTLAGPIAVWRAGWQLAVTGSLGSAVWVSFQRVAIGLTLGTAVGLALALVSGLSRAGDDLVDSPIQMLRFLPIIGLQPLVVLWFGIGNVAKISLIAFAVVFPIYINTSAAIRDIDPRYTELGRVVGLGRWAQIRRVILPGALPGFLVGLRFAGAVSWLILVFAEQINATNGIGYLIIKAQTFLQTDIILVALAVYAVLGLLTDALIRLLERKALSWQPSR